MTVGELLHRILAGYRVQTAFIPPLKLVIQARKIENYYVSGTVCEEES